MRYRTVIKISAAVLSLLLIATGCSTAVNAPVATSTAPVTTTAPAATVAATETPAATTSPTAAPTETPAPTPSATASVDYTVNSDAFALYNLVKLGMTKDEVDKATGQAGEAQSDYDKQNNIYTYTDSQARGVRVTFNDQKKAYSKEVFYNDTASVLGPLNPKEVTHDMYDQISTSMTYADVVKILGSDGVIGCVTADKSDCISNIALKRFWGNKDGSYVEVNFKPDGTIDTLSYNDYQPE